MNLKGRNFLTLKDFTSEEIFKISHILGISDNQIGLYFFTQKVQKVGIYQEVQPV